jgi:phosphoribosyl 1,2-cyclic phosphodiesterase
MRFASLGSGSRGNATLIEAGSTCLLVDCGFSAAETTRRLARLGKSPDDLSAILVTHEHGDHVKGVRVLARRHALPVWATHGSLAAGGLTDLPSVMEGCAHQAFSIGDFAISPFPVPHDAREPCQFVFEDGRHRLGLLTDLGHATQHLMQAMGACDALLLEANHDDHMLATGPYPPSLKARVGGDWGHMSNAQSARLLKALDTSRLQHLVAMHLSEKNNTPELAVAALSGALGCEPGWIGVARQDSGLGWRELG